MQREDGVGAEAWRIGATSGRVPEPVVRELRHRDQGHYPGGGSEAGPRQKAGTAVVGVEAESAGRSHGPERRLPEDGQGGAA